MKIVINRCVGGFGLSDQAWRMLVARKARQCKDLPGDFQITWGTDQGHRRADLDLVAIVEMLGDRASALGAKLRVADIPDGVDWVIHEIDGKEQIGLKEETHQKPQEFARQSFGSPIPAGSFSRQEIEYFL
jgi:hypothetical protein